MGFELGSEKVDVSVGEKADEVEDAWRMGFVKRG